MASQTLELALKPATLIKRYKRFLADICLPSGEQLTIHCPNTGSMKNCGAPGDTIWYSTSENRKRKYPHTWELTATPQGHFICVNTQRANQLLAKEIEAKRLVEFAAYDHVRREVRYGESSRIDLLLQQPALPDLYIEIKSCTLREDNHIGYFPDAITSRGQKHLRELMAMAEQGHLAMLLFAVMHTGIKEVRPAAHIDACYTKLLTQAKDSGVEVRAYQATLDKAGISVKGVLPVVL